MLRSSSVISLQRAQAALQAVNALHGGGMGSMAIPADTSGIGGGGAQSPVLRVIVENLFYPVTLDVLHQVQADFVIQPSQILILYIIGLTVLFFNLALYSGWWALK